MSRGTALLCALGIAIASVACSETDAGVTTKVKAKFAADDTVKAYQIDVDTANKVVTLKGNVETSAAKTMAVQIARDTEGVASVVDQLTVTAKPMATVDTPNLPNLSMSIARDTTGVKGVNDKLTVGR